MLTQKIFLVVILFLSSTIAVPYDSQSDNDVAPLFSSDSAQVIPDSYIVVFKSQLKKEKIVYHQSCIHDYLAEEKRSLVKRGLLEDMLSGIKHTFDFKNFQGYSGRFTKEILEKIKSSEKVKKKKKRDYTRDNSQI